MAEELGRITRPEAKQFKNGRRLFLLPLIFIPPSPPKALQEIVERYWQEALSQIEGLESRIGDVKRIYHEMIALDGESGLSMLASLNTGSYNLARKMTQKGSEFSSIEDSDLLNEFMDWGRCLSTGLYSHKVLTTVLQSYQETQEQRNKEMANRLDNSLGNDEIGLLIVTENHRMQFPADIEVFYVAPPSLDEYKRWLRHQEEPVKQEKPQEEEPVKAEKKAEPETEAAKPNSESTKPARKTRKKKAS